MRNTGKVDFGANEYTFNHHEGDDKNVTYTYDAGNKTLKRNGNVVVNNIFNFKIENKVDNVAITISFTMNGKEYRTTLSYRGGSSG